MEDEAKRDSLLETNIYTGSRKEYPQETHMEEKNR